MGLITLVLILGVVRFHRWPAPLRGASPVGSHDSEARPDDSAVPKLDAVVREPAFADPPKLRQFFPHSVVPGGVRSAAELRHTMRADPIVHAHYEGMDAERIVPFRLASALPAYVSYRVKDRTYWTSKKVNLVAGELILSDGVRWVRGRCGNLISFVPQKPFLPPAEEPKPAEFDRASLGPVPLVWERSGGSAAVPMGYLDEPAPEEATSAPLTLEATQAGRRRLLALPILAAIPVVATIGRAGSDPKSPVPWEPNGLVLVGMFAAVRLVSPRLSRCRLFRRHVNQP